MKVWRKKAISSGSRDVRGVSKPSAAKSMYQKAVTMYDSLRYTFQKIRRRNSMNLPGVSDVIENEDRRRFFGAAAAASLFAKPMTEEVLAQLGKINLPNSGFVSGVADLAGKYADDMDTECSEEVRKADRFTGLWRDIPWQSKHRVDQMFRITAEMRNIAKFGIPEYILRDIYLLARDMAMTQPVENVSVLRSVSLSARHDMAFNWWYKRLTQNYLQERYNRFQALVEVDPRVAMFEDYKKKWQEAFPFLDLDDPEDGDDYREVSMVPSLGRKSEIGANSPFNVVSDMLAFVKERTNGK